MGSATCAAEAPEGQASAGQVSQTRKSMECTVSAAEVERCVEVSTRVTMSNGGTSSGRNLVLIKGQGRGQGLVKMEADGRLLFADPDKEPKGECFIRQNHYTNRSFAVCIFESEDYVGRYIWANTKANDFAVSGMETQDVQVAYWRKVHYSKVTRNIEHYNGDIWYCLQYWGDERYRTTKLQDGLFMVAEGTGTSAKFALRSLKELKDKKNGIFSFTPVTH